ncbi:MAG: aldo/keto reductase [Cytophagales bacterium]|jgi:aryl-alcohol dehydrogenase-like predicted oxidoreductase|uniref:aldo/keto reductase n=1 Tax=Microcystis sp. M122S2 TaxID=2771142 RepID=UPI002590A262|nr:aldo/keto reductase [Microcystis sp. M122S2]MCA6378168.1 aldo/keto reductase [Cytophagales bacterium]MCA2770971.1 aldo/keto reductase [Microcystis sp. M122S2]MCA6388880.1 aldo/keto reductase [Cytophagales bacterium]MCA6391110.1 aldo/keto reductase [Cytophagales bacterium]MCA6397745.1 aldo/keto reductase [Cytophagales bacterium]
MANSIVLGTVQFGLDYGISNSSGKTKIDEAFRILSLASDKQITTLDTAYAYGDSLDVIGRFHNETRLFFLINSKFKTDNNLSISEQLERTLEKLRVDCLETYFYHRCEDLGRSDVDQELNSLKLKGYIKKIGVSIYTNSEFKRAIETENIDVIQIPFNLLDNFSKRGSLIQSAKEQGKEIQCRSVFLQGLFFMESNNLPAKLKDLIPYLNKLKELAQKMKISVEGMALKYALNQSLIDNVLIGVNTQDQLASNLINSKLELPSNFVQEIDCIDVSETNLLNPQNWV